MQAQELEREVEAWRSQLRKGSLELAVLLSLRKEARYGLELVELLNARHVHVKLALVEQQPRTNRGRDAALRWREIGRRHARRASGKAL